MESEHMGNNGMPANEQAIQYRKAAELGEATGQNGLGFMALASVTKTALV